MGAAHLSAYAGTRQIQNMNSFTAGLTAADQYNQYKTFKGPDHAQWLAPMPALCKYSLHSYTVVTLQRATTVAPV